MAQMMIDGRLRTSASTFDVLNPATEAVLAQAPNCSQEQLNEAVSAAHAAFGSWRETSVEQRRVILRACAQRMRERKADFVRLLTQEQGKPTAGAERECNGAAAWFEHTAALDLPHETIEAAGQRLVEVRRRPYGVVAAITPWNFPVMLAVWKIAPALLAGNTVVIKPSPYTPLTTLLLGAVLADLLPAGVLNVVSGTDELGAWLTAHPLVRKISFTGSIATGRKVYSAAAQGIRGLTLELGGNDPAIVLGDVDPRSVAQKIFASAFANCGQVCAAVKRVYAHQSIHDSLVQELAALAKQARVGNGLEEGVTMGPLNNRTQYLRVLELMESAHREGGKFVVGSPQPRPGKGYFIEPAVVTELADGARLVVEEQFGPVLPVLRFSDTEEAIARANATEFGLSASVWGRDVDRATAIAGHLEAGTVWVNQHMTIMPNAPISGVKSSGLGAENGHWGLESFTQLQTVQVAA